MRQRRSERPSDRWRLVLAGEAMAVEGPAGAWHPGTAAALTLAYLALEGPTPRERLAGLLWPERPEARARANLRQLLLRIRAVAPIVEGDPLRLSAGVRVDADEPPTDALGGTATRDLLAGLDASHRPALAEWLAARRGEHAARVRRALLEAVAAARQARDLPAAAASADRLAQLDPWSETVCRTVMEVALERGEPSAALRAFRRLRRVLARELGTDPGAETVALARTCARAAARLPGQAAAAADHSWRVARRAESGGWLREGADLLLQLSRGLESGPELARVLTELAWLEHRLGWDRRAQEHARRALTVSGEGPAREESAATGHAHGKDRPEPDARELDAPESPVRADACFVLGSLAWADGDLLAARDRWSRALRSLRGGDGAARLRLSLDLALVEDALEHPAEARNHYLAALALARGLGENAAEAKILNNLGTQLVHEQRASDGLALLRRALAIARERRDRLLEGYILDSVAQAHMAVPAGAQATAEAVATARAAAGSAADVGVRAGDLRLQIEAFLTLSRVSVAAGDGSAARRFADAALARAEASGWGPLVAAAREQATRAGREARAGDAGVTARDAG